MTIDIRYAETDDDIIAVHRFLCVVAGPTLPGQIDAKDSVNEVWRCTKHDVVIMAVRNNILIGTLGLICVPEWWNHKIKFLANRWMFAIPGSKAWRRMLKEAKTIGVGSNMEVRIFSENRGKVLILNRNPLRDRPNPALVTQAA
jgi:hypothetical protein